jgi:hypothetical protein
MEGDIDVFDFLLAEKLHMSLEAVGNLSNREHIAWRAFDVYVKAMAAMK